MIEYDLPFEIYKKCNSCDGYGTVNLTTHNTKRLEFWAKKLGLEEAFYGYNLCNKCNGTGLVLDYKLKDLELDV